MTPLRHAITHANRRSASTLPQTAQEPRSTLDMAILAALATLRDRGRLVASWTQIAHSDVVAEWFEGRGMGDAPRHDMVIDRLRVLVASGQVMAPEGCGGFKLPEEVVQ